MWRLPLLVVLLALLACSNGAQSVTTLASSTTTSQPTTTTRPTTTTTRPTTTTLAGFLSPMNGLPVTDAALLDRRVMAVKIDNAPGARPQSGLNEADAVSMARAGADILVAHMGLTTAITPRIFRNY